VAGRSVAVVGGGLAGLAAAVELTDNGYEVELFERSRLLGGRATSFSVGGREVDNGQHVFLGCCAEFIAFVERVNMGHALHVQERFDVLVLRRGFAASRLRAASLPAPWHLLAAFAGYRHLGLGSKLKVARALASSRSKRDRGRCGTFAEWLAHQGQDEAALRTFWEPFFVPALNASLEEMETAEALFVLSTAFLSDARAARFGFSTVPLARIAASAAERLAGVHCSTPVLGFDYSTDGSAVRGIVTAKGRRAFDAVVLALTPPQLARLASGPLREGIPSLDGYRARPIIDVHLWHDRGRLGFDFAALIGSPVQWIFEKAEGYLCCSISAANEYVLRDTADLVRLCWDEVTEIVPGLAGANLERGWVTRNVEATFSAPPGGARISGPATAVPNVAVAGSWTDATWPDTMEAAVRSGRVAARHIMTNVVKTAVKPEKHGVPIYGAQRSGRG